MKRYKIIERAYKDQLENEVNAAVEEGYTPLGGISCYNLHSGTPVYVQAMYMTADELKQAELTAASIY